MNDLITVAIRAHNDMPLLADTLAAVKRQTVPCRIIGFDNASTDGGRELLDQSADLVVHVPEGAYVPGRVLNQAMRASRSEIVVFLNADCGPLDAHWLASLIEPFSDPHTGATFSRQLPRPDCNPLAAFDTESAYGDGSRQGQWRHCFSMASSAVRRSVWENIPFSETLGYSEDIAWSWAVRNTGFDIRYVAASQVFHSHNYSDAQWRKRQYGEGKAEACIFQWTPWQRSLLRYTLLPTVRQIARDMAYCCRTGSWRGLMASPGYRLAQALGRRQGFLEGLRQQPTNADWTAAPEAAR